MERLPSLQLALPEWIYEFIPPEDRIFFSDEEKMRFVLGLAGENVRRESGGPFAAAVFNADRGTLIAPGINMVIPTHWSGAHAEMVAFAVAQQRLESHDLGDRGMPRCELFSSTEPCTMCLGATLWAGVRRLVCAARDGDARAIGFDEGPKPQDWEGELRRRGVEVRRELLLEEGQKILFSYLESGGPIYNPRHAGTGST